MVAMNNVLVTRAILYNPIAQAKYQSCRHNSTLLNLAAPHVGAKVLLWGAHNFMEVSPLLTIIWSDVRYKIRFVSHIFYR